AGIWAWLLDVPQNRQEKICEAYHYNPTAGHLSYIQTFAHICKKYYWLKLPTSVRHRNRPCRECQHRKMQPKPKEGLHLIR
ncbi:hypothetical protein IscW_ISCW007059, partial [Ixodes scapularis]